MFKKQQSVEEDFMQYDSDDVIGEQPKQETSFLSTLIRSLTALILLGVLVVGSLFSYRFFQNETPAQVVEQVPSSAPSPTPVAKEQEAQKMYTQDEMQDIVQMVMQQMEEEQEKVTTKTIEPENGESIEKETSLIASLQNTEVDHMEELEVQSSIDEKVSTTEITKESNDATVDNYNKVIIKKTSNTYANVDALSLKIGDIVKEMQDKKTTKNSTYTQQITKEVHIRENAMRIIIVRSGDTLSKISKRAYGSAMAYEKILHANPDLIKNPNRIYIGQRLRIPVNENL